MNRFKFFFAILFFAITVKADFREVDTADIDFAAHLLAKNLDSCWKEPKRQISIGVDSIKNKTSQSVDKEKVPYDGPDQVLFEPNSFTARYSATIDSTARSTSKILGEHNDKL